MKILFALIGAVVGVLLVRAVALVEVEVMAWQVFWELLAQGETFPIKDLLSSTTLWKCIGGAVCGGGVGYWLAYEIHKANQPEGVSDE